MARCHLKAISMIVWIETTLFFAGRTRGVAGWSVAAGWAGCRGWASADTGCQIRGWSYRPTFFEPVSMASGEVGVVGASGISAVSLI